MTRYCSIASRRLPKQWPKFARSAVLHVVSLASTAMTLARGRLHEKERGSRVHADELVALQGEIELLREEIRIRDDRMARLDPCRRPHYQPIGRMAILELRARRGWSLGDTARRFLVEARTISSWMKRLDDADERALVATATPVNRFPEFVRYIVRRFKVLCPRMGKRKIAEVLARAGLHLGATTVRRITLETESVSPDDGDEAAIAGKTTIIARGPHHVWGTDLTVVPTQAGFWTMLCPFAWLQRWPFCYWVAVVVDHFSRRSASRSFEKCQQPVISRRAWTSRLPMSERHLGTSSPTRGSSSSARCSGTGASSTGSAHDTEPCGSTDRSQ